MKNVFRLLMIVLSIVFAGIMMVPAAGQEESEGGTIVIPNRVPASLEQVMFSPVYCNVSHCDDSRSLMYIDLIGVDLDMGMLAPNRPGALTESWEFSQDNRVLTLHLRDDMTWSDGTPITSADVLMDHELMLVPESGHTGAWVTEYIESLEAPDDYTLVFTFHQGSCSSLFNAGLNVLPSHIYRELIDEVGYEGLAEHEWFQHPTMTSGPFRFGERRPDESFTLVVNENYVDAVLGYVNPDEIVLAFAPDQDTQVDMFLDGEINVLSAVYDHRMSDIWAAGEAGEIQVYEYPGGDWASVAMNWADPANPQPALDEDGNRIEQGLHPIFGDKLTRQAIARAIDVDAMIEEAVLGFGERMPAHITPSSWAYNHELPPIPYDPKLALEMLAEAGWVPENPGASAGPENRLVCQGCLYATQVDPGFGGSYLEFELLSVVGSYLGDAIGSLFRDQLVHIGIAVDFQPVEWSRLMELWLAQTYDATLIGWRAGYPADPDSTQIFGHASDVLGSGYNFTSFYNEEYFALEEMALNVPGCGMAERTEIYWRMQEIMQDELPYIFLFAETGLYAARNEVEGFAPYPANLWWNVDTWSVRGGD